LTRDAAEQVRWSSRKGDEMGGLGWTWRWDQGRALSTLFRTLVQAVTAVQIITGRPDATQLMARVLITHVKN
jgi:hypothetical protein